ncbi:tetratricopeptide repeat protein [Spirosoma sp. HMF3257]|nr:tetratricopeptide repeat protein [Spirosoma telluris]
MDASIGAVEARIFENLLLQRIYDRLSENERDVFLAASIFFTRTPLAALSAVVDKPADELTPILAALRDWSLCFWDAQEQLFDVHALTRTWLRNQQQPTLDQFKTFSQRAGKFFKEQPTWDDELLAKAYFEQAEAWEAYAETTLKLEGHYRLIGLYPAARALAQEVLVKNISPLLNAEAQNSLGMLSISIGDYAEALSYLEQSMSNYLQIGDKKGEGTILNNISQIYDAQGDYGRALSYLEQSLSIQQQIGDKSGEGTTLNNLATTAYAQGDYDRALSYLEQSLSIQQQIGDKSGEGTTLNNISQIYRVAGDNDRALSYLEQSLRIRQQIGDKKGEGTTLNNISQIYDAQGDYGRALSYLEQSLSIQQQIGDKSGEGTTLNNISQIYRVAGDNDRALSYLEQSLSIQQQIGDKKGEGTTLNNLATTAYAQGIMIGR